MAAQGEETVYESVAQLGKFCLFNEGLGAATGVPAPDPETSRKKSKKMFLDSGFAGADARAPE
jgi:hypothetical protein